MSIQITNPGCGGFVEGMSLKGGVYEDSLVEYPQFLSISLSGT